MDHERLSQPSTDHNVYNLGSILVWQNVAASDLIDVGNILINDGKVIRKAKGEGGEVCVIDACCGRSIQEVVDHCDITVPAVYVLGLATDPFGA